jgi:hypothetical protein
METTQSGYVVVDALRGDDSSAERDSWTQPFATVARAMRVVRDFDTLLVYPGTYKESPEAPLDVSSQPGGGAPLWLKDRRCVTIRGIGMPEICLTGHGCGLTIENGTDIMVEGLTFRGAGPLTEPRPYYFALLLLSGTNESITVRDCVFTESGNYGLGHLFGSRMTNNSVIKNNRFLTGGHLNHPRLGRDGAAIAVGGSGNVIYGNRVERWVRGMEFESGDQPELDAPTSRNIFSHNKIMQCWWQHVVVLPRHRQAGLFDQLLIEGNIIQGWGWEPQRSLDPDSTFAHEGIYFGGGVNALICGNQISDMGDGFGLRMKADWCNIEDVLVTNNRIWNVGRGAIQARGNPIGSTVSPIQLAAQRQGGAIKLSVSGAKGQTVQLQRRPAVSERWTHWQNLTLSGGTDEVNDPDLERGQSFYRAVVDDPSPPCQLKRCRFVKNKVGPCGGRGIWLKGDFNIVECNDIHHCASTAPWEGVYVEGGCQNAVRCNLLVDCLPVADQGINTLGLSNDHFWETLRPPA